MQLPVKNRGNNKCENPLDEKFVSETQTKKLFPTRRGQFFQVIIKTKCSITNKREEDHKNFPWIRFNIKNTIRPGSPNNNNNNNKNSSPKRCSDFPGVKLIKKRSPVIKHIF